jgi:sulfite exporter TauE/SafE
MSVLVALGIAVSGTVHCAGMCGPLAMLAGRRFGLYLLGKTSTYLFLGALAGALGETVSALAGPRPLYLGGAALLVVAALDSFGYFRWPLPSRLLAVVAHNGGALLLGAANGLVPCPLTMAFITMAASTASPVSGAALMLILSFTSAVPLAACAFAGRRLKRFPAATGLVMIGVAVLMLWRGLAAGSCH